MRFGIHLIRAILVSVTGFNVAFAQDLLDASGRQYSIQPGDVLEISVWNEQALQREVLVAPDGRISFPLAGEVTAVGKSVTALREEISGLLGKYISEPVVTVNISQIRGNKIYVVGQVDRPGEFVINPLIDVMQALSMAGGTTAYASLNAIII